MTAHYNGYSCSDDDVENVLSEIDVFLNTTFQNSTLSDEKLFLVLSNYLGSNETVENYVSLIVDKNFTFDAQHDNMSSFKVLKDHCNCEFIIYFHCCFSL